MTVPDISAEDLARVEAMLMEDIAKAVATGPGWDPDRGAGYLGGKWVDVESAQGRPACGVCAIGALCLARQPDADEKWADDTQSAAQVLGVDEEWCEALYWAVTETDGINDPFYDYSPQVWELSRRLRAHGDALTAAKATK